MFPLNFQMNTASWRFDRVRAQSDHQRFTLAATADCSNVDPATASLASHAEWF